MSDDITIPGDEAYLSFGGWAKPMPNPPALHERRRYIVDVECTAAGVRTSSKGERGTRALSVLRVKEVTGVVVPAKSADEEDDDTPPMFDDNGDPIDDASADEGDEIMAKRAEDKAAGEGEGADETSNDAEAADADANDPDADPWPGDADAPVEGSADDVAPEEQMGEVASVTPMFSDAKKAKAK